MATEYPALNRIHVVGYSANDTNYPVLGLVADPRVAGYKVPEDFSACPDKRYPNHIFTGAQPISGDQRVRHTWEILPSPWVPFTRYDDDLGPVQGRRRSVKNEGQKASLTSSTKISYEGREGSSIVLNEVEETWEIKVDDDGNSLFPVKIRDFYDASRGAVEERRQLFVPTGEEVATLENINGIITQTSYEPYNEYLSYKVVQTYAVDGPKLVGKQTNNEGQLLTVTTQRKAADGYIPPQPTATRTVEASREDIESLVERVIDTPEVFAGKSFQVAKVDLTPQKFRAAQEDVTLEQTIEGDASQPVLASGEFSKSEQQINKFLKRVATTSRAIESVVVLSEKILTPEGQLATRVLTLKSGDQTFAPSAKLIDANVEALGDGRTVKTEVSVNNVFDQGQLSSEKPDIFPEQFVANIPTITTSSVGESTSASVPTLANNELESTATRLTEQKVRLSKRVRNVTLQSLPTLRGQDYDPSTNITIPFTEKITASGATLNQNYTTIDPLSSDYDLVRTFDVTQIKEQLDDIFLEFPTRANLSLPPILKKVSIIWDKTEDNGFYNGVGAGTGTGVSFSNSVSVNGRSDATIQITPSFQIEIEDTYGNNIPTKSYFFFMPYPVTIEGILARVNADLWPVFRPKSHIISAVGQTKKVALNGDATVKANGGGGSYSTDYSQGNGRSFTSSFNTVTATIPPTLHGTITIDTSGENDARASASFGASASAGGASVSVNDEAEIRIKSKDPEEIAATYPDDIPRSGRYLIDSRIEIYQYGYAKVYAEVLDAEIFAQDTPITGSSGETNPRPIFKNPSRPLRP